MYVLPCGNYKKHEWEDLCMYTGTLLNYDNVKEGKKDQIVFRVFRTCHPIVTRFT